MKNTFRRFLQWFISLFQNKQLDDSQQNQWDLLRKKTLESAQLLAERNLPLSESIDLSEPEKKVEEFVKRQKQRLDDEFYREKEIAASRLNSISPTIIISELRIEARNAVTDFSTSMSMFLDEAMLEERDYTGRQAELERFKKENQLSREPSYPESKLIYYGVLLLLLLIEMVSNAYFFMTANPAGFLGGFLQASLFACCSIFLAVITAFFMRLTVRRGWINKIFFSFITTLSLSFLIFFNTTIAHIRDLQMQDALLSMSDLKLQTFLDRFHAGFFILDSAESYLVFSILMVFSLIAIIDIFKMDDPYPGYGKRHRNLKSSHKNWIEISSLQRDRLQESKVKALSLIRDLGRQIERRFIMQNETLSNLHLKEQKHMNSILETESIANDILIGFRKINKEKRSSPPPAYFGEKMIVLNRYQKDISFSTLSLVDMEGIQKQFSEIRESAIAEINERYETAVKKLSKVILN